MRPIATDGVHGVVYVSVSCMLPMAPAVPRSVLPRWRCNVTYLWFLGDVIFVHA